MTARHIVSRSGKEIPIPEELQLPEEMEGLQPVVNGRHIDECLDNLYLEIGDVRALKFKNPLAGAEWYNDEKIPDLIINLSLEEEYLHFVCKYILNIELLPFQAAIIRMLWTKQLPILLASRGAGKSWVLSVYIVLRLLLHQGCRIAVVGAGLRQSMVLFNYVMQIYDNAPILQDITGGSGKKNYGPKRDVNMCYWNVGSSRAVFLPLGNGEKIRGQRANIIVCDEFASVSAEIFETVVRGFAAVKSEGVHRNVSQAYRAKLMKHLSKDKIEELAGMEDEIKIRGSLVGNQIVLSGTAFYRFNHFFEYYSYYKAIILSGGDKDLLQREFPDREIATSIDPSEYAIMRIPCTALPPGLMDPTVMAQGEATMDPMIFGMEYHCIFPSDSEGFYLASWLHNCTVKMGSENSFSAKLHGHSGKQYIMGIDPASESDNFAINVLEINEDGTRHCVYQWSTNRKEFEEAKMRKKIDNDIKDYNSFCIRHIRDLYRRFDLKLIVLDTGGGGVSIREGLRDPDKLLDEYDDIILDMDDENSDPEEGKLMLKMIEFSNYDWRRNAHWGLRSDFLNKKILFPAYDAASIEVDSYLEDKLGDTLEDCYLEIEQCKKEITLIKHDQTPQGHEKWDVPKVIGIDADQAQKKIKRDRFTSILLANWGCRILDEEKDQFTPEKYGVFGGTAKSFRRGRGVYNTKKGYVGKGATKMPANHLRGIMFKR